MKEKNKMILKIGLFEGEKDVVGWVKEVEIGESTNEKDKTVLVSYLGKVCQKTLQGIFRAKGICGSTDEYEKQTKLN